MVMENNAQALVRQLVEALGPIAATGFNDNQHRAPDNVVATDVTNPLTMGQVRAATAAVAAAQAALAAATTP